jgi:hypothetical protein
MLGFIFAATVLLILGHLGLYGTLVNFFHIPANDARRSLLIILLILGISFPITSVLVFWKEAFFTNLLYSISSVWLGFVWYAVLAAVLIWLISFAGQLLKMNLPLAHILTSLLLIAAAITFYGTWNALHPVVRQYTITMKDLPTAWQNQKVVQLSDIHLGPVHRQTFLKKVVEMTNQENPAAVFITGDLFDGGGRDLAALADPLENLKSTFGNFYIIGNHETYIGVDRSIAALDGLQINILRDQVVEVSGIQILGIDYPTSSTKKDLTPDLSKLDQSKPSIVLWHEPKYVEQIKNAKVNLLLSGHTHDGQVWPFGEITKWVYKGFNNGLKTDGDFNIYTSPGIGTWGPPLRTGNRPTIAVFTLQNKL